MTSLRSLGLVLLGLFGAGRPASSQVLILPQVAALVEGRSCAFHLCLGSGVRAGLPGSGASLPHEDWIWTILDGGGALDGATGVYTAPRTDQPRLVRIQARYRPFPEVRSEALLLVLPFQPFELVGKVLGPHWLDEYSLELPFLGPGPGQQPGHPDRSRVDSLFRRNLGHHTVGYGLPFTLRWTPLEGAHGQLLTCLQGDGATRLDVSGQASRELRFRARVQECTVEGLRRLPGRNEAWVSQTQRATVRVRGLLPLASHALAEPGHQDGVGLSARFREPFGLARVMAGPMTHPQISYLVTDPQSHVIRSILPEVKVGTPWGVPDHPGHRDAGSPSFLRRIASSLCGRISTKGAKPLFNRPTFLLAEQSSGHPFLGTRTHTWKCLVADSGNHVLRVLRPDGTTGTWAGTPGAAGHRDSDQGTARFNQPRGLAMDPAGNLYVADQGNQVIRRISAFGQVTTVAGTPGEAGTLDGQGPAARFSRLQGLAISTNQRSWFLYAVDGHAIRRISLPDGEVTTELGVVDTPGFRNVRHPEPPETRAAALRQPCLREPCGITVINEGSFVIADTGNHSVRIWVPATDELATVVGDPALGENRWGLLRDGLDGPLDERYAALAAPRTLVPGDPDPRSFLVATGSCVGEIAPVAAWPNLMGVELHCLPAQPDQPCAIRFTVTPEDPAAGPRPIHYSVDFLEADGTLAERREGTGATGTAVTLEGTFAQAGTGTVAVRCVTSQGVSCGARQEVTVQ